MPSSRTLRKLCQVRDLMRDFADEVPGYLNNRRIAAALDAVSLTSGVGAIPANMQRCYDALIALGVMSADERPLLDAWLADVAALGR